MQDFKEMPKRIKLFSPRNCINPSIDYYIPLLFPFWGRGERKNISPYDADRYDDWTNEGSRYFHLAENIEYYDIVVLPYEWRQGYDAAFELAQAAASHNKPFILFFNSDSTEDIPIDNAIVFRTSACRSKRKPHVYGLPGWYSDLGKKYLSGKIYPKEKSDIPVVGYTGYIDYKTPWEFFKFVTRYVRHPGMDQSGIHLRGECVRNLSCSRLVNTDFTIREGGQTGTSSLKERREFVDTILNSDYSLVCRGGGNFSYRLYEVLSLGRIPLFIDTDCLLPYDHIVNWKEFCLWVDEKQVEDIAKIVADFHYGISDEQFRTMQFKARQVYDEWLCPTGYYKNLWRCIPCLDFDKSEQT